MAELSSMFAVLPVLIAAAVFAPGMVAPRCAGCSEIVQPDGDLDLLFEWCGWYVGWRSYACPCCGQRHTRFALTRDAACVQVQTHVVI